MQLKYQHSSQRSLRVLFVNYEFPPIGGGAGRVTENLARHFARLGCEVTVFTSAFSDLPLAETKDGYHIVRMPTWRRRQDRCSIPEMLFFLMKSLMVLPQWARQNRPHVSLSFFTLPCTPAVYLLKRWLNIPYVLSLQGGDVPGFQGGPVLAFFHALTKGIVRFLWKHAFLRVANSRGLARLAAETSSLPIDVIPNGVDPFFFLDTGMRNAAISNDPLTLISVGRLSPQKDLSTLLRAFQKLGGMHVLKIVGDGPERALLEALVRELDLSDRVFFLGWRMPVELKALYAEADLFVMSSIDEGMPIAVLEAMATGLPIVGTQVSGMDELIKEGENGYTVPSRSVDSLAHALAQVTRSRDALKAMGESSRVRAQAYDWAHIADAYLACCEKAIKHSV